MMNREEIEINMCTLNFRIFQKTQFYDTFNSSNGCDQKIVVEQSARNSNYYRTPNNPDAVEYVIKSPSISILVTNDVAVGYDKDEPVSDLCMQDRRVQEQWEQIKGSEKGSIFVGSEYQKYVEYKKSSVLWNPLSSSKSVAKDDSRNSSIKGSTIDSTTSENTILDTYNHLCFSR